ncbi:Phosphatidylinositol 5-phosphate 4-kinase type-2 alpha [Podila epigama]|nr:Phosphatidylinositol 5-phosphate 4-kinase type-2 alpha [Podila epigama]
MEPTLSRHLRHAIKSVLHFTSLGPETMDLKSTSHGIGNWEAFVSPTVLPTPLPPPPSLPPKSSRQEQEQETHTHDSKASIGGVHSILPRLSRSPSLVKPSTSNDNIPAKTILDPPLPIEPSIPHPSNDKSTPPQLTQQQQLQQRSNINQESNAVPSTLSTSPSSMTSTPPIVVRGFRSSSVSHPSATDVVYPRPMSTAMGRAKELSTPARAVAPPQDEDIKQPNVLHETPTTSPTTNNDFDATVAHVNPEPRGRIEQLQLQQTQPSKLVNEQTDRAQSRPSRLWSKVRRAVHGGFSPGNSPIASIYQFSGSGKGNTRSMSDTHLPDRPISSTSTSSFNAVMPSFSSSVLSLLSDDQMSSTGDRQPAVSSTSRPSLVFETPPETAPSSPISEATAKHGHGHGHGHGHDKHPLPDLARRSSTKSPAARAEVTTAESNVNHFVATRRPESGHSRKYSMDSRPESMVQELEIRLEQGLATRSPHRLSRLSTGSTHTRSSSHRPDDEIPLSKRRSNTLIDHPPLHEQEQHEASKDIANQDFDQFLTTHQVYIEQEDNEPGTIGESTKHESRSPRDSKDSAEILKERAATLFKIEGRFKGKSEDTHRNSTVLLSTSEESQLQQSESRMLLSPTADLLNPSKQDRRKSAISFGGYFSSPSLAAVRRARDQMEHSMSGMETGSSGEIIHLRRTSFFERPSMLSGHHGSHSPNYPSSPSKTEDQQSGAAAGTRLQESRPQKTDDAMSASTTAATPLSGQPSSGVESGRRKKLPHKISPLIITGVSSLPSPMVAPMSAGIPRSISLDRHFYSVDQVHEWNIPSYGRVKFTDHSPMVFQAVRERFQYTLQDLDEALSQPMTVMRTPGKSDAIFFVSHNHGRFLLKTLRGAEPENLKSFLSDYMAHIHKHPNTLLPRYLGMYTFEKLSSSKIVGGGAGPLSSSVGGGVGGTGVGGGVGGGGIHFGAERDSSAPHRQGNGRAGSRYSFAGAGAGAAPTSQHHQQQNFHLNGTLLSGKEDGLPSKVVVVMLANVFDTPNVVHERYDFKGSNVGRCTLSEQPPVTVEPPTPVQADPSYGLNAEGVFKDPFRRNGQQDRNGTEMQDFSHNNNSRSEGAAHGATSTLPSTTAKTNKEEISNLTLKEMDFQNRVSSGKTHLIHVGEAKRKEILAQLEEDTALLRKHSFMDYSMLVGIHIVPKNTIEHQDSVSESSGRRGQEDGSMGSDADYSSFDSEDEDGNGDDTPEISDDGDDSNPNNTKLQTMDRLLALMRARGILGDEQAAYISQLKNATAKTLRDVMALVQGGGDEESFGDDGDEGDGTGGEGNMKTLNGRRTSRMQRSKDSSDWGAFRTPAGTMRQLPNRRTVVNKATVAGTRTSRTSPRRHRNRLSHQASTSFERPSPSSKYHGKKENRNPPSPLRHKASAPLLFSATGEHANDIRAWSQGVPSEGLPDGYEAVYYFGLIDILQKYNIVKWLERNLKGANARLLGGGGVGVGGGSGGGGGGALGMPGTLLSPPGTAPPHQTHGRFPSTSFSASSLYQFFPMASVSEPSLRLASANAGVSESFPPNTSTLSVLLENPSSRPASTLSLAEHHQHSLSDKRSSASSSSGSTSTHHISQSSSNSSSNTNGMTKLTTPSMSLSGGPSAQSSHHSSQPSHQSSKSMMLSSSSYRNSIDAPSHHHHHHQQQRQQHNVFGSSPSFPGTVPLSSSPQAEQQQQQQQQQQKQSRHQSQPSYQAFYQNHQHVEVSVEEPGRYSERLVDYMRGVLT